MRKSLVLEIIVDDEWSTPVVNFHVNDARAMGVLAATVRYITGQAPEVNLLVASASAVREPEVHRILAYGARTLREVHPCVTVLEAPPGKGTEALKKWKY